MDWMTIKKAIPDLINKYKFVILILLIGIVLIRIPGENNDVTDESGIMPAPDTILSLEQQLEELLSHIKGAGEVRIVLTTAVGEEILYQSDHDESVNGDDSTIRIDTITVKDSDDNETGLIKQINPPVYLGAVVVCQGADSPAVRLAITEAISRATGLGADKISVLKMK